MQLIGYVSPALARSGSDSTSQPRPRRLLTRARDLTVDRAWRLLTFGDATFVQRASVRWSPLLALSVPFADGDQLLCPPASDEGLYQRLVHVGAGRTPGVPGRHGLLRR